MIYVFNPISGAPTDGTPVAGEVLPFTLLQVTMLNQMDDHFLHPLLMLDRDLKVTACSLRSASVVFNIVVMILRRSYKGSSSYKVERKPEVINRYRFRKAWLVKFYFCHSLISELHVPDFLPYLCG